MDLNWLHSILYGFVSSLANILPVCAQAHQVMLMKFFGVTEHMNFMNLLIRLAVIYALYNSSRSHFVRMRRALALARIPKRKRKRPLDTRSLMDWSLLITMLLPAALGVYLYQYVTSWQSNLLLIALFLFLNGVILYTPQFLPSSNKDARTLSRIEGLLMGLGGTASILPGVSAMGATLSIGSVCGVAQSFCLDMAMMMNMFLIGGMAIYDIIGIATFGIGALSVTILIRYLITAAVAYGGTLLGIRIMRYFAKEHGYAFFGIYCWGLALFTFILNLMA